MKVIKYKVINSFTILNNLFEKHDIINISVDNYTEQRKIFNVHRTYLGYINNTCFDYDVKPYIEEVKTDSPIPIPQGFVKDKSKEYHVFKNKIKGFKVYIPDCKDNNQALLKFQNNFAHIYIDDWYYIGVYN